MTLDLLELAIAFNDLVNTSDGDDWTETSRADLEFFAQIGHEMATMIVEKVVHRD